MENFGLNFNTVLLFALAWIAATALFFFWRSRKKNLTVHYPHGDSIAKRNDIIDVPRILNVTVVFGDRQLEADELYADMVVRFDDVIKGTYVVPDKLKERFGFLNQTENIEEVSVPESEPFQEVSDDVLNNPPEMPEIKFTSDDAPSDIDSSDVDGDFYNAGNFTSDF